MGGGFDWVTAIASWGPAGVLVVLLLTGIVEPKWSRIRMEKDRDDWKQAFDTEREAHGVTRDALSAANARAEAALESANTMTRILEQAGHRPAPGATP